MWPWSNFWSEIRIDLCIAINFYTGKELFKYLVGWLVMMCRWSYYPAILIFVVESIFDQVKCQLILILYYILLPGTKIGTWLDQILTLLQKSKWQDNMIIYTSWPIILPNIYSLGSNLNIWRINDLIPVRI
jgi:hypothetical protein